MGKVLIRQATKADLDRFYEGRARPTVSAMVGEGEDGAILGIGGLAYVNGRVILFSDIRAEGRQYKLAMHKIARALMNQARAAGHRLIFAEGKEPTSDRWLRRLNFERDGAFYRWRG